MPRTTSAPAAPPLLSAASAATELGIGPDRLADLLAAGRLPCVRIGSRRRMVRREDLNAFIRARLEHDAAAGKVQGLTVHEVARDSGVGEGTVRRWIRVGILPAKLLPAIGGGVAYRVRPADLDRLLAATSAR